jgi:hypothetical protein
MAIQFGLLTSSTGQRIRETNSPASRVIGLIFTEVPPRRVEVANHHAGRADCELRNVLERPAEAVELWSDFDNVRTTGNW